MSLCIAILAAGSATRFGGGKLDADLRGKPLGRHALDAALALGRPVIVVGDDAPHFARDAKTVNEADLLINPRAAEGLGTSVALAARHARTIGVDGLLLLAADMPLVSLTTLRAIVETGALAAVLHADGHPGIPAYFPAASLDSLVRLEGDQGAGKLLRGADVASVHVPDGELFDVDTPEALELLRLS